MNIPGLIQPTAKLSDAEIAERVDRIRTLETHSTSTDTVIGQVNALRIVEFRRDWNRMMVREDS